MNIKVFNIRLEKEHCQIDQDKMNAFLDTVEVKLTSTNFVTTGTKDYWSAVVFYNLKSEKQVTYLETDLTIEEKELFAALKQWRNEKAMELNSPHFIICHNSELISIAKTKPKTVLDFKKIKGFGELKTKKFANEIISLLKTF